MTKDLANLDETRRALQDFKAKKVETDRMLEQMDMMDDLALFETEAYSAFVNVSSRYGVIIEALERRKKHLEST